MLRTCAGLLGRDAPGWRVAGVLTWTILASMFGANGTAAIAKTPGETYCYNETCRRVRTLAETAALVGQRLTLKASFYDHCARDRFNPCSLTSSGEVFRADAADNAASPDLPDGTSLLLFNPATQMAAVVRINNAGPYRGDRQLDVSRGTAEALGFHTRGLAALEAIVLQAPGRVEARYRHLRRYESTAGFIGAFASLDEAKKSLSVDAAAPSVIAALPTIEPDAPFANLIATLPDLTMPMEAPSVDLQDAASPGPDVVAMIVAGLPPLSARVLLGLPPLVIISDSHHHPVGDDVRSQNLAIARPEIEQGIASDTVASPVTVAALEPSPSSQRSPRPRWLLDVIATAEPRHREPAITIAVRTPSWVGLVASVRLIIADAVEQARP